MSHRPLFVPDVFTQRKRLIATQFIKYTTGLMGSDPVGWHMPCTGGVGIVREMKEKPA